MIPLTSDRLWQLGHCGAIISLLALIGLSLTWELWLAPLRPGGSLFALKALLLVLPLRGLLKRRRYTYQWSSLFILLFLLEGLMRSWADKGLSQVLAWCEVALALWFFVSVLIVCKRPQQTT